MSAPVIHLEEYYLKKVHIERKGLLGNAVDSDSFQFDYEVKKRDDDDRYLMLVLRVFSDSSVSEPSSINYDLDFEIFGIFRFDEEVSQSDKQGLVLINGGTILYGILRGVLSTVSGGFPEGPLYLPTVMMADVIRDIENRRKESSRAKQTTKSKAKKKIIKKRSARKK